MDCAICDSNEEANFKCFDNIFVRLWYPEHRNKCQHAFHRDCLEGWLAEKTMEHADFTCPCCRAVYVDKDRLQHAVGLFQCFAQRKEQLQSGNKQ